MAPFQLDLFQSYFFKKNTENNQVGNKGIEANNVDTKNIQYFEVKPQKQIQSSQPKLLSQTQFPQSQSPQKVSLTSLPSSPSHASLPSPQFKQPKQSIKLEFEVKRRKSWQVTWKRKVAGELPVLKLPAVFEFAPQEVLTQMILWAKLAVEKKSSQTTLYMRRIEREVSEYLDTPFLCPSKQHLLAKWEAHLKREGARKGRALKRHNPQGMYRDLLPVFTWVNQTFFEGKLEVELTWSTRRTGTSFHTIKNDEHGKPYHLISISKGYDHPDVSKEILGGILYHECLHITIPPTVKDGRRVVHPPKFKKAERQYPFYKEWIAWHKNQLPLELGKRHYHFKLRQKMKSLGKVFFGQ